MYKSEYAHDDWKRADHDAVRNNVGWYYFKHRLMEVNGEDAEAFLDRICVNTIAGCKIGRAKYTNILNEDGTIFDDCVVFCMADDQFWISTLYAPRLEEWMWDHEFDFDVDYEEISDDWDMYSVQGPNSPKLMNALCAEPVDDMKFFEIRDNAIADVEVKIARSGYTGEKWGFEIYVNSDDSDAIVAELREKGAALDAREVREFQVMVLTLATEAGFCLMSDMRDLNPLEVEPNLKINWDKEFVGKDALLPLKDLDHQKWALLGFEAADVDAHIECASKGGVGQAVIKDGEEVGRCTKFTYSYTFGKAIGFVRVLADKVHVGDTVTMRGFEATIVDRRWI